MSVLVIFINPELAASESIATIEEFRKPSTYFGMDICESIKRLAKELSATIVPAGTAGKNSIQIS